MAKRARARDREDVPDTDNPVDEQRAGTGEKPPEQAPPRPDEGTGARRRAQADRYQPDRPRKQDS